MRRSCNEKGNDGSSDTASLVSTVDDESADPCAAVSGIDAVHHEPHDVTVAQDGERMPGRAGLLAE